MATSYFLLPTYYFAKRWVGGDIEAGTELGDGTLHVAMAFDHGVGVDEEEVANYLLHLLLLGFGAGVGGGAVGTQATFVADADAVVVVGAAVGAYFTQFSVLGETAVSPDVEVVPDVFESSFHVVAAKLIYGVVDVLRRCRTVYDDEVY
jgi:hypothetical protein